MEMVNSFVHEQKLPETMDLSVITVIPKPGRDCNNPADFRPISLINCDKKIITKVLNNRLALILPSIIHYDQAGFILNRDLKTNIRTCVSLTQYATKHNLDLTLMAVDAEKAFDRLEWSYLYKVLERFNFPEEFINMVKTLYKAPKAKVYTNGIISEAFLLNRGTAQGCPLSPALFVIAIEPLAEKIRQAENIKGITVGKKEYKLSLFADDLLLYLRNIDKSIPCVIDIMSQFSKISGYKINVNKTEILAIGQGEIKLENFKQFKIQRNRIKHLGCYISANKKQLYKDNFLALKNEFKQSLNNYKDLKLNLIGRINLIKMTWLSKFIYVFQGIPLTPPKSFFKEINSLISSFIWSGKTARIKKELLFSPRQEGGLSLPNLELYQIASQMFYIDRIINNTNEDSWLDIENHQLKPNNLLSILFSKKKVKTDNFVINSTLNMWKKLNSFCG